MWSGQLAAAHPPFDERNLIGRPRAVAWHAPAPQSLEYSVGVFAHVSVGSEVEVQPHRLAVLLAKEWLDVGFESDWFIVFRQAHRRFLLWR
jgi:hypothetical protein